MSALREIEAAIEQLSKDEAFALGEWLEKMLADKWDTQLAEDIEAGRLDEIASRAMEEHKVGQSPNAA